MAHDMAECLTAKGWQVRADPDGGITGGAIPAGQEDSFLEDQAACISEYGYDIPRPPITAEEAETIWDELLAVAECVKGLGYDVAEPPSRGFAVEALQQQPIDLGWWPHDHVPPSERDRSYTECPTPVL